MSTPQPSDPSSPAAHLEELRRSVDRPPEEFDVTALMPIITPSSFYEEGNWVGPYLPQRAAELAITWAVLGAEQTMRYLDRPLVDYWEAKGIDWRKQASDNLIRRTTEEFYTGAYARADGTLYALVFMHRDGCGPSRLLFQAEIARQLRGGYTFAVPERSVGLALADDATPAEREKVVGVVRGCFEKGSRPVSPKFYGSMDLALRRK